MTKIYRISKKRGAGGGFETDKGNVHSGTVSMTEHVHKYFDIVRQLLLKKSNEAWESCGESGRAGQSFFEKREKSTSPPGKARDDRRSLFG